ncbi:MAG: hypothetical protein GF315_00755 [candidate division Zixibacteria bacterium]|nr:hypothetical protein [candidate division Zixibacteria bacterium]
MHFKPHDDSIVTMIRDWFNLFIRYKFRAFLHSSNYNIVLKAPYKELELKDRWRRKHQYRMEILDENTIGKLNKLVYPWRRKEFKEYLSNDSVCFVGIYRNRIVSYGWTSVGRVDPHVQDLYGMVIPMGEKDVWNVDIVVDPEYRGRGAEFYGMAYGSEYWISQGMENVWSAVNIRDRGSMKIHYRLGYRPVYMHIMKKYLGIMKTKLIPVNEETLPELKEITKGKNIDFIWKNGEQG